MGGASAQTWANLANPAPPSCGIPMEGCDVPSHKPSTCTCMASPSHPWHTPRGMSLVSLKAWANTQRLSSPSCGIPMEGWDGPLHMYRHGKHVGVPSLGANPHGVACVCVQGLEARANMALGYVNHALLALWWSDSMCHHLGRLVWTPHGPCQSLKAICKGLKKERILVGVTNRQVVHHQTFW